MRSDGVVARPEHVGDDVGSGGARFAFLGIPRRCQLWVSAAALAALVAPWLLRPLGQQPATEDQILTGLVLVTLSILNVEIGRLLEGGMSDTQRPHKALSAWAFATALLLPTWWLLPVVIVSYSHARWRGLRVPLWKWIGSAAYIVVAGLVAAATSRAIMGDQAALMDGAGSRGLLAVAVGAAAFLAVETVLFHGSAYLNLASDEGWLRETLRSPSFYLTEASVLLIGGLSAAIWSGGRWFVLLLLPVYGLTQRAALHEPLRDRADHDDKTGLLRFESWRLLAVADVGRCVRRRQPWSVVFADLDRFKSFNDTWGHLAGDDALVATARVLVTELRERDIIARFGGEEFCVFLPGIGAHDAAGIAERMRRAVEAMPLPADQQLTISLGVASIEPGQQGIEFVEALTAADKGLIEAKQSGRNRVIQTVLAGP